MLQIRLGLVIQIVLCIQASILPLARSTFEETFVSQLDNRVAGEASTSLYTLRC